VGTGFPKRSCSTNREVTKQNCDAKALSDEGNANSAHSREGGNPDAAKRVLCEVLGPRFRGDERVIAADSV
jgi:hypothetical protein